jgi:hypothetical protein
MTIRTAATMVEVPLDGSPSEFEAPEGFPVYRGAVPATYPEWEPLHGDEDSREGHWVQYPCLLVLWGTE